MGSISFEKVVREARLLNPMLGFRLDVQPIEFRRDPLTRRRCRINLKRAERVKQTAVEDPHLLTEIAEKSRAGCFFCHENIEAKTPRFPEELLPHGRIRLGSACLFPNLYPFSEHHAVAVLSEEHFLTLDQFTPELIAQGLKVAVEFLQRVHQQHPAAKYGTISWNNLPPAGASIVHPHLQVTADLNPTREFEDSMARSERYLEENSGQYWSDLVEVEKAQGSRFIGQTGNVTWLASFAPQGANEVLAVIHGVSTLTQLGGVEAEAFSLGLSRILKGYHTLGVQSFNLTSFSAPLGEPRRHYSLNFKLISRPRLAAFYASDVGFIERLHDEVVVNTKPEATAEELRKYFK